MKGEGVGEVDGRGGGGEGGMRLEGRGEVGREGEGGEAEGREEGGEKRQLGVLVR